MSDPTHVFVKLAKGKTFRTPWGARLRAGKPIRVPFNHPNLEYYRASKRFEVVESISRPVRARKRPVPPKRKKAPVSPAPPKADAESGESEAEAKVEKVSTSLTRSQLLNAAKELGLTIRSSDNKTDIVAKINEQRALALSKAEKDAEAAAKSTKAEGQE